MRDLSDQAQLDRSRDQQRRDAVTNDLIIKTLMGSKDGRRYLWLEMEACYIFQSTLELGENGYAVTAWREGRRARGLKLLADITRLAPKDYITMTTENRVVDEKDELDARPDSAVA